mgnify:CR=1 FL=1|jgi:membrane fusion protein
MIFRHEVITSKQNTLYGETLSSRKDVWFFISLLYFSSTFGIVLFLCLATYSRSQVVEGELNFSKGMYLVTPDKKGVASNVFVRNGMSVTQGTPLITVSTEQESGLGGSVEQLTKHNLEMQLSLYQERRQLFTHSTSSQSKALDTIAKSLKRKLEESESELAFQQKIIELAQDKEANFKSLLKKGAISKDAMKTQEKELIIEQRNLKTLAIQHASLEQELQENQYNRLQLNNKLAESQNDIANKMAEIEQSIVAIDSRINYTMVSPISGTVTAIKVYEGAAINTEEVIMAVTPNDSSLQANLFVPNRSIGLIHIGDKVNLKLDAFPYERFGTVPATLTAISIVPTVNHLQNSKQSDYLVQATLEKNTIKVYGKQTAFQSGMSFKADIVTQKQSIIAWLFDPIFAAWKS